MLDWNVIVPSLISGAALVAASRAAKYSKPTGNGFANRVTKQLDRIESRLDRHIENHHNLP